MTLTPGRGTKPHFRGRPRPRARDPSPGYEPGLSEGPAAARGKARAQSPGSRELPRASVKTRGTSPGTLLGLPGRGLAPHKAQRPTSSNTGSLEPGQPQYSPWGSRRGHEPHPGWGLSHPWGGGRSPPGASLAAWR